MSFLNYDPYDPKDKPKNTPRAWITGIFWLIVAILAFIGLITVLIRLTGG